MRAKVVLVLTFLFFSIYNAQAANQKVLYSFTGGPDGANPYAGVVLDAAGNLYGVTRFGGLYQQGTVFQLSPSENGWTETVLYNFTGGADGYDPVGGLAIDEAGNLYGTAASEWGSSCGTVFKLSPSSGSWTFTVLHTFAGSPDGCTPFSNLRYHDGYVSGTTVAGGSFNCGTLFSVPASPGGYYYLTDLFKERNGDQPWGNFTDDGEGTTRYGGTKGYGNVYQWWYTWHEIIKTVHAFNSKGSGGYYPAGDLLTLIVNRQPIMYGTTTMGGIGGRGTVYQLTPGSKAATWHFSVLHGFSGPDGASPHTGLTADSAGNLYGTTTFGGTDPGNGGTVFKLSPGPKKKWIHTLLYSFTDGVDGGEVYSGVVLDNAGNLYGTTWAGGANSQGVVYEITP